MGLLAALGAMGNDGSSPNALQRFGYMTDPDSGNTATKLMESQNLRDIGQQFASGKINQQQYLQMLAMNDPMAARQVAGVNTPSVSQLAQQYIDAKNRGDTQMANALEMFGKTFDKGVLTNPQGTVAPITGYAPAISNIASAKAGAEQQAKKDVDLAMDPQIKAAETNATKIAEASTEAGLSLPDVAASAENAINAINQMVGTDDGKLKPHPGLSSAVGPVSSKLPTVFGDTADFEALIKQVQSGAFLQSIKQMQGFGALSNQEGERATNAATRMSTAQSQDGFIKAAKEYRETIARGVERLKKKSTGDFSAPTDTAAESKTIGGVTYIKQGNDWYQQ